MAVIITTTNILRVNLTNSYGDSKNVNLPNAKDGLSLADVRGCFENLLTNTFLAGTEYLTAVKAARKIETKTTPLE